MKKGSFGFMKLENLVLNSEILISCKSEPNIGIKTKRENEEWHPHNNEIVPDRYVLKTDKQYKVIFQKL